MVFKRRWFQSEMENDRVRVEGERERSEFQVMYWGISKGIWQVMYKMRFIKKWSIKHAGLSKKSWIKNEIRKLNCENYRLRYKFEIHLLNLSRISNTVKLSAAEK